MVVAGNCIRNTTAVVADAVAAAITPICYLCGVAKVYMHPSIHQLITVRLATHLSNTAVADSSSRFPFAGAQTERHAVVALSTLSISSATAGVIII